MPADRLLHPKLGHSEKVGSLSDLEFRVWIAYQLASDDYGVMRQSAVTVQAADDALAKRQPRVVQAALVKLVTVGLLRMFDHQARRYVYQETWQDFQRVKHPRDTMQPAPPAIGLATCSTQTRKLFQNHPFIVAEGLGKDFGNISETVPQPLSGNGSLACARTRETANGTRRTAHGSSEESPRETITPPMDEWARELVNLYPPQAKCGPHLIEGPLFTVLVGDPPTLDPWLSWDRLKAQLDAQKRSHQWRVKQMIPRLDKWLREGLYLQELPEHPVSTQVSEKTARSLSSAAEFVKEGGHGTV